MSSRYLPSGIDSDDEEDATVEVVDPKSTANPLSVGRDQESVADYNRSMQTFNSSSTGARRQRGSVVEATDAGMFETFNVGPSSTGNLRDSVTSQSQTGTTSPNAKPPSQSSFFAAPAATAKTFHADPTSSAFPTDPQFEASVPIPSSSGSAEDQRSRRGLSIFGGKNSEEPAGPMHSGSATTATAGNARHSSAPSPPQPPPAEKKTITMEFGDEYVGEVCKMPNTNFYLPHGQGTLHSLTGGHSYVGEFKNRMRDGLGKLVTNDYFLWCKWKDNRPDWSSSVRIDFTNGEKYCGYLKAVTEPALQAKLKKDKTPLSKFSQWVRTTVLIREKWGEMVFNDGSRYFGQWEANQPDGFGCAVMENGDRYIGNWMKGKYNGPGTLFSSKRSKRMTGGGLLYDGIWEKGVFDAEEGHVTFPCRTRLTGEWKNSVTVAKAKIHHPSKQESAIRWLNAFQWETLLCGCQEGAKNRDIAQAIPLKNKLLRASTKEEAEHLLKQIIKENPAINNALKIFRRCFYFLYGTCGISSEIGAGLGNNRLGWCFVRSTYGGCIHRGRGKPITKADVDAALGDITSFVASLRRWLDELVSEQGQQVIYEMELEGFLSRHFLDTLLQDVHQPLFNLYVQSYRKEQVKLTAALRRLVNVTPDDLGVLFGRHREEKLFSPYEDAIRSLQGLNKAYTLTSKLNCLKKMSSDIDLSTRLGQMKLDGAELQRLSTFVRDRMDATGESLHAMATKQVSASATDEAQAMAPLLSQALAVQSGSADDLLPIHQYVLMEANIPYLYSHVQLLLDLSSDELLVDGTSQDAFCITTLHACTTILPQLHKNIRDEKHVITPLAVYEKRIDDAMTFPPHVVDAILVWLPSVLAALGTVTLPLVPGVDDAVNLEVFNFSTEKGKGERLQTLTGLPVRSIVPNLLESEAIPLKGSEGAVLTRLELLKRSRREKERQAVQGCLREAIKVLQSVDIVIYARTGAAHTEDTTTIPVVQVPKLSTPSGNRTVTDEAPTELDRLFTQLTVEDLYVVPPRLSASVCVELAQFIAVSRRG